MTKKEKFLNLKLHEELELNEDTSVIKVVGGYIYKFYANNGFGFWISKTRFVPDDRKTTW